MPFEIGAYLFSPNQCTEWRLIVVRRTDLTRCCVDVSYAGRELLVRAWLGKERVESLSWFDRLIRLAFVGPFSDCVKSHFHH